MYVVAISIISLMVLGSFVFWYEYHDTGLILFFSNLQHKNLEEVKQILRETQLEESRKRELSSALHACFKDWLYGNAF